MSPPSQLRFPLRASPSAPTAQKRSSGTPTLPLTWNGPVSSLLSSRPLRYYQPHFAPEETQAERLYDIQGPPQLWVAELESPANLIPPPRPVPLPPAALQTQWQDRNASCSPHTRPALGCPLDDRPFPGPGASGWALLISHWAPDRTGTAPSGAA